MRLFPKLHRVIEKSEPKLSQQGRRPRRRPDAHYPSHVAAITQTLQQRVLLSAAPMIMADQTSFSTSHDQTLSTMMPVVSGFDSDGDAITLQLSGNVAHGSLTLNQDATFSYTPNSGFTGQDSFQVRYVDSHGDASSNVTISLDVTNTPPSIMANQTSFWTSHDQTLTSMMPVVSGFDPDMEPATLQLVSNVAHGSLTLNQDATFSYTPSSGFTGQDSFQVRYVDSMGAASSVVTVSISVSNTPPSIMANQTSFWMSHDQTLTSMMPVVSGFDPDMEPATLQLVSNVAHGSLTLNQDGTFFYTPTAQFVGQDSFQVRYVDSLGAASSTVSISISVSNMSPTITANQTSYWMSHDNILFAMMPAVSGSDPDMEPLTLQLVSNVAHGSLTLNQDGTFSYTPATNYVGQDSFQVRYVDNLGAVSSTVMVTISVSNMSPTFGSSTATVTVDENTPIGTTILTGDAFDPDDQSLAYSITSGNGAGYFSLDSSGQLKVAGNLDYETMTQHQFTLVLQAVDSLGASATKTVTVNVADVNDPPVLQNFNVSTNGTVYTFSGSVTDESTPACYVVFGGLLAGQQVQCDANGTFSYTVTLGGGATGLVFGTAYDSLGQSSSTSFVVV